VAAALLASPAGSAFAIGNIDLNGFFTVGATKSDSSTDSQDGNITDSVGFQEDSRIGLQVYADINPKMAVTAQILGSNRKNDSFDAEFDWAFVSYAFNDNVSLRGGKVKLPTFLISDYYEVGYAYPWIRPPQEVYYSNPINAITGADALVRANLGGAADLLIQPYFGNSRGEDALVPQEFLIGTPAEGNAVYNGFKADNMAGVNVALSGDFYTIRAGYLQTSVQPDGSNKWDDVNFASVGATMDWNNVIAYTEYFQREIDGFSNNGFPNQKGWYATLGYRFDRFLPHVTYASLRENQDNDDPGVALEQDSITLGVRYELGAGAALKVEAQNIDPEGDSRGLLMEPTDDVNVYSVAVDVIF